MLRNYFVIALRQFKKQKMYSVIKIGGFAFSITACILISLYIKDELSFDKSYPDAERIYRVYGEFHYEGIHEKGTSVPPPLAGAVKADFPEIEKAGRLMPNQLFDGAGSNQLMSADKMESTFEEGFTYADQEALDIFGLPMVYGDRSTALAQPRTMVMTRKKAEKYFPGINPVGKVMYLNNDKSKPYTVGGVIENMPATSHLQWDFYLTLTGVEFWPGEQEGWRSSNYEAYLLLKPGTDYQAFEKKVSDHLIRKYILPSMKSAGQADAEKMANAGRMRLQPVGDIHLKSYDIDSPTARGDIRFIWLFASIAIFILVLACINFVNLSTAKSANRAREVGLRKVVGSARTSIISQFLTESVLFSIFSFVLGLFMAWALLPFFNSVAAKSLSIPWLTWWFIPALLASAIVVGIAAGLYPAYYLSAFRPVKVLKGDVSRGSRNSLLRNSLVVFQFTTSIILIIGTFVIYNQMEYIMNSKLGYDKEQVLLLQSTHTLDKQVISFKNELAKISNVQRVSISDYLPVTGTKRNGNQIFNKGKENEENGASSQVWIADDDYLPTMGIKLVDGRNFSEDRAGDSMSVVINQTLAKQLGITKADGQPITNGWQHFTVVGIIQDFNFESIKQKISPLVIRPGLSSSIVSLKVNTADMKSLLASVTSVWKKFSPNQSIRYTFLDDRFARMYDDVQRMQRIFSSFAVIAIAIACLGLFALSAFMAEQRRKEVSIRKVLGASVTEVTSLLSRDFVRLVFIALVIACPIAWWAMSKWLQDYVYRISLSWWIFAGAGLLVIAIALFTVSFQAIGAALRNPVKSLRSE
jgi:putative ABC transport system permease protein